MKLFIMELHSQHHEKMHIRIEKTTNISDSFESNWSTAKYSLAVKTAGFLASYSYDNCDYFVQSFQIYIKLRMVLHVSLTSGILYLSHYMTFAEGLRDHGCTMHWKKTCNGPTLLMKYAGPLLNATVGPRRPVNKAQFEPPVVISVCALFV